MRSDLIIDPDRVADFRRPVWGLELFLIFGILVANAGSARVAEALSALLPYLGWRPGLSPFAALRKVYRSGRGDRARWDVEHLGADLLAMGLGQYRRKSVFLARAADSELDLRTGSLEQLQALPGVGFKTARFFLLYSRPMQPYAVLDTHTLAHLREMYETHPYEAIPVETPRTRWEYLRVERIALDDAAARGMSYVEYDIWIRTYRLARARRSD